MKKSSRDTLGDVGEQRMTTLGSWMAWRLMGAVGLLGALCTMGDTNCWRWLGGLMESSRERIIGLMEAVVGSIAAMVGSMGDVANSMKPWAR